MHPYRGNESLTVSAHFNLVTFWVWEVNRFLFDQLVHFRVIVVSRIEGRESNNHLIGQDSNSPPIHREGVSLFV